MSANPDLGTSLTFTLGVLSSGQLSVPRAIPTLWLAEHEPVPNRDDPGKQMLRRGTSSLLVLDSGH